jgi:hypothetical protein
VTKRLLISCTVIALFAITAFLQLSGTAPVAPAAASFSTQSTGGDFSTLLARVEKSEDFDLRTGLEITPAGLAITRDGAANLYGDLYNNNIQSVRVNGKLATIDPATRSWSYRIEPGSGLLNAGVNRILVRAFMGTGNSARLLRQRHIDIYYDSGAWTEKSGVLKVEKTAGLKAIVKRFINGQTRHVEHWTAADSPYHVSADVTVPEHHLLVIEPGVSVFFDENTRLVVRGELRAAGTDFERIHMRATPGQAFVSDIRPELEQSPPHWGGIQFHDSESPGNLVSKVDIEYAQSPNGSIGVHRSQLRIDDVGISGTLEFKIFTNESSLIVENCIFGNMFPEDLNPLDMTPMIDNTGEHIKGLAGVSFPKDGYYIIRNNYFGTNKGHNDIIDVDSNQYPDSVLQILNNYFAGAGDEAIDGGGDILVDGNIFRDFRKDRENDTDGDVNVISTGDTLKTVMVITRNVFIDVDHVVNFKRGAFGYFENNTISGITPPYSSPGTESPPRKQSFSVINLIIPDRDDPLHSPPRDPAGLGAYTSGNIFVDIPQTIFGHPDLNPIPDDFKSRLKFWMKSYWQVSLLEMHHSLLESADLVANADGMHGRKFDYDLGTARFVNPAQLDFTLEAGSPGYRKGPNGIDMGAAVPAGANISGEPTGTTASDRATLVVGGPGIFSFVYRVNDGPWSDEIEIGDPRDFDTGAIRRTATLELENLQEGRYTVYVRGRNFAGVLQPENEPFRSKSWVVKKDAEN